ncbi:S24 family peptidase [Lentilactobacillus otakiensis]|uniref:S24 family peptidase n=1 Tax=Lentilactobacillus otakiensis TaxID=481720 RepID=UPI003D17BCA8
MFAQNLRYLRKQHHLNQTELAHQLGRKSVASVSEWESGKYTPKLPIVEKIANLFEVNASDLLQRDLSQLDHQTDIVPLYEQLTPTHQQRVYAYAQRLKDEQVDNVVQLPSKILQIDGVVSAGTGEELVDERDEMDYQGKLSQFDYAVKINGDSMEPQFHDQQIVLVKATTDADNGQIVIAYVDGRSYIKQLKKTDQHCRLASLNPKYAPIDVQGNESFAIKGVVTGILDN